ncbi:chondroitinase-B domain-containing protein [Bacteroidota bacterium]
MKSFAQILLLNSSVLCLSFLLLLSLKITAQSYFVSSAMEISNIMNTAEPGDTIIMRNGDWTDERIIFNGNGNEEKNIYLIAETPGYVILSGTSTLRIAGSFLTVSGLYFLNGRSSSGAVVEFRNGSSKPAYNCRLSETAIVNYNPSSKSTGYKWVSVYGEHNRVDHCYFKGKTHDGTTLVVWLDGEPNYHLIDSNYFAYRPELGFNGGETIRIGTSDYSMTDSYTTVEYNYFERCNGETEIISNKSGHNTFRYNTFYESEGTLTLRHGNFAEVYGNFFIGNNKSRTGGVRVIGEDHKVYNNYFEYLDGTGFRAALPIMNGVPNSPLNRYFQVKRAQIINNTFINCSETFIVGAGNDSERSLPPENCIIANNVAISNYRLIEYEDDPINLFYENNIMFGGPLGIEQPEGIEISDPELSEIQDDLWRPSVSSPLINSGSDSYTFVTDDIDGQQRSAPVDIGADETSDDLISRTILTGDDIGPDWYPPPALPVRVVQVKAGQDSLLNAVNSIQEGDIIELTTSGGIYSNNSDIEIHFPVIIRTANGLQLMPVIQQNDPNNSSRTIFEIKDGGSLDIKGLELDGMAGTDTPAKYLIRTDDNPMDNHYNLFIDSCYLHDVSIEGNGNFFRAYELTFADSIVITNTLFTNCGKEGIRLKDEASGSSNYNVDHFEVYNCTFWNISKEAIYIYAGDNVIFTPGPDITINHCTFYNCGYEDHPTVLLDECDGTKIKNSIFTNCSVNSTLIELYGPVSSLSYSNFYNVGDIELFRDSYTGNGIVDFNPLFEDPDNGNFTLPGNSPVLNRSEDSSPLGDLRWATNPRTYFTLQIVTFGEGDVLVDPETAGLNYNPGSIINLTAVPGVNYEFFGWSGDIISDDSTVQVTMESDKTVISVFSKITHTVEISNIPDNFKLFPSYPNPFNPETNIKYQVPEQSHVTINIFDINGQLVSVLINQFHVVGYYETVWHPGNISSGTYIINMITDEFNESKKIIYLK